MLCTVGQRACTKGLSVPNASGLRNDASHQERELPKGMSLIVASRVCWLYGGLQFLSAMTVLTLALRASKPESGLVFTGALWSVVAVAYCYAGYALGKRRRAGGIVAMTVTGLLAAFQLADLRPLTLVGLALNLAILALVGLGWRHLRRPERISHSGERSGADLPRTNGDKSPQ